MHFFSLIRKSEQVNTWKAEQVIPIDSMSLEASSLSLTQPQTMLQQLRTSEYWHTELRSPDGKRGMWRINPVPTTSIIAPETFL